MLGSITRPRPARSAGDVGCIWSVRPRDSGAKSEYGCEYARERFRAGRTRLASGAACATNQTQTPEIVVVTMQAVKFRRLRGARGAGGNGRIFTFFGSFGHIIAVTNLGRSKFLSMVQKLDQTRTHGTADLRGCQPAPLRGLGSRHDAAQSFRRSPQRHVRKHPWHAPTCESIAVLPKRRFAPLAQARP
jgi:hypothetical protein